MHEKLNPFTGSVLATVIFYLSGFLLTSLGHIGEGCRSPSAYENLLGRWRYYEENYPTAISDEYTFLSDGKFERYSTTSTAYEFYPSSERGTFAVDDSVNPPLLTLTNRELQYTYMSQNVVERPADIQMTLDFGQYDNGQRTLVLCDLGGGCSERYTFAGE